MDNEVPALKMRKNLSFEVRCFINTYDSTDMLSPDFLGFLRHWEPGTRCLPDRHFSGYAQNIRGGISFEIVR